MTSAAFLVFFSRAARGENAWRRLIAPALALLALAGTIVLAVQNCAGLLAVAPGDTAARARPARYAVVAVIGAGGRLLLRSGRPAGSAAIGRGGRPGEQA